MPIFKASSYLIGKPIWKRLNEILSRPLTFIFLKCASHRVNKIISPILREKS